MRQFQWTQGDIQKALFVIVECYNENAALDYITSFNAMSEIPATTSTISGIAATAITGGSQIFYTWVEGNFGLIVGGITDGYARTVANALIDAYK